jgi:hypothetical protein
MFVQFVAMCYYEFFSEQLRQVKMGLGTATGDGNMTPRLSWKQREN